MKVGDYVITYSRTNDDIVHLDHIVACGVATEFGADTTVIVKDRFGNKDCAYIDRAEKIDEGRYMLWMLEN
jgi:hypothetical protein